MSSVWKRNARVEKYTRTALPRRWHHKSVFEVVRFVDTDYCNPADHSVAPQSELREDLISSPARQTPVLHLDYPMHLTDLLFQCPSNHTDSPGERVYLF